MTSPIPFCLKDKYLWNSEEELEKEQTRNEFKKFFEGVIPEDILPRNPPEYGTVEFKLEMLEGWYKNRFKFNSTLQELKQIARPGEAPYYLSVIFYKPTPSWSKYQTFVGKR